MSGVQELYLFEIKSKVVKKRLKTWSYSIVELRPPRQNGTTQRPNFPCILQHFHGVVSRPRDTTRSALWKKPTGFKVLRLPRQNVLHAPGCDKMAILDHGEVLPQTLLHARRCGKTQILQDLELPHSKNFIIVSSLKDCRYYTLPCGALFLVIYSIFTV